LKARMLKTIQIFSNSNVFLSQLFSGLADLKLTALEELKFGAECTFNAAECETIEPLVAFIEHAPSSASKPVCQAIGSQSPSPHVCSPQAAHQRSLRPL